MHELLTPSVGLGGAGWVAFLSLVAFVARAIIRGDLVPRSTHERELEVSQHDANEWRTEGRIKDQQLAEKDVQLGHMKEGFTSLNALIAALQGALRGDGNGDR